MRKRMARFWDRRAREDAYYFVDTRLDYGSPDLDRFWEQGRSDLDTMLGALEATLRPSDSVVEIGCGVGRLTRVIAGRSADVRALDVSVEMLARARRHNPHLDSVEWLPSDGHSLAGIEDQSADVCLSYVVFQHIPDPAITLAYIAEMGRVLRPGGWAAFQVSNDPEVHRRHRSDAGPLARLRSRQARAPRGRSRPEWLGSAIELDALRRVATDAGMTVERIRHEGTQYCLVLCRRAGPPVAPG